MSEKVMVLVKDSKLVSYLGSLQFSGNYFLPEDWLKSPTTYNNHINSLAHERSIKD